MGGQLRALRGVNLKRDKGVSLSVFSRSQISGKISRLLNRRYISSELSKEYYKIGCERLQIADNNFNREDLDIINQIAYGEEKLVSIAA